jgi:hypothetical protein
MPVCLLALPCLALPCLTDQARAALSACGGDPFLARISICSCTPDFCQRNFHLARIRRFDLLHSAAERRQSENSAALPLVRLVHCALPPGLIAALRLQCTLQAGSSASFTSHYCPQYTYKPAAHLQCRYPNLVFIGKKKTRKPGTCTYFRRNHTTRRLQAAAAKNGRKNPQDRTAHGIGPDSRIPLPCLHVPRFGETYDDFRGWACHF